ncbi:MAG: hypothetical protein WD045_17345 [Pirellulaceae bacterium]
MTAKLKLIELQEGVDTVLARPMIMSVVGKPFSIDGGGFHWEGTFHPLRDGKVGAELKFVVRSSSKDKEDDQEWHRITTQVDSRFSAKPGETKRIRLNSTQRLEVTLEVMQADDVQAEDRPIAKPGTHSKAAPSTRLPTAAVKEVSAVFRLYDRNDDGKARLLSEPSLRTAVGRPANFVTGGELVKEGAKPDPWEFGTRINLHVQELKEDRVDVEFKFSLTSLWSPKQGWIDGWFNSDREDHISGVSFQSRYMAKLGEWKIIRSGTGRWLEVKFEEVTP